MNLKYTLSAVAIAVALNADAQNWIPDTVSMGENYSKDVYYSLDNGMVANPDNTNWHIAVEALNPMGDPHGGVGIWTNEADKAGNVVKLYSMHSAASSTFLTATEADTVGKMSNELHNDTSTYAMGAFNAYATGHPNYGWGEYFTAEEQGFPAHSVVGDSLYLLVINEPAVPGPPGPVTQVGAYLVWPRVMQNANEYILYARAIGSTEVDTIDINIANANRVFKYYDLITKEVVDREPARNNWDFNITNYMDLYGGFAIAGITGVLSNFNVKVAEVSNIVPNDADYSSLTVNQYSENINTIGGDWKYLEGVTYALTDSLSYFIKQPTGDIWQVYFDYFAKDTTTQERKVGLQKRKVYTEPPISVNQFNENINTIVLAPNPSENNQTNILIDAKKDLKNTQIIITDISGRTVMSVNKTIKAGFQQLRLDVGNYAPGIYFINLDGEGWRNTQKLVVN